MKFRKFFMRLFLVMALGVMCVQLKVNSELRKEYGSLAAKRDIYKKELSCANERLKITEQDRLKAWGVLQEYSTGEIADIAWVDDNGKEYVDTMKTTNEFFINKFDTILQSLK